MSMKKKSKKTPSKEKPVKAFNVNNIFDENSFDFHLAGGPLHTELLIASAIYKLGIFSSTIVIFIKFFFNYFKGIKKESLFQ